MSHPEGTGHTVAPTPRAASAQLSVLVVDDDADHRADLRDLLEDHGYVVAEAANGKEALQYIFDRPADRPCLVLLDLSMPVMSGAEFLAVLRKYLRLASIPIIVISGNQPLLGPVVQGGIAGLLRKPYRAEDVLSLVRRHAGGTPRPLQKLRDAE